MVIELTRITSNDCISTTDARTHFYQQSHQYKLGFFIHEPHNFSSLCLSPSSKATYTIFFLNGILQQHFYFMVPESVHISHFPAYIYYYFPLSTE